MKLCLKYERNTKMLMKCCTRQGGNLREAMSREPVGMGWYNSGKAIARDLAMGLAFLHRHRVVSLGFWVCNLGLVSHCRRRRAYIWGCT